MPAVPQQAVPPSAAPPPATQQHDRRSPSPRLWRMRCAEVTGCAVVLAAAAGTGAGLAAGPGVAGIALAAAAGRAALPPWVSRQPLPARAPPGSDEGPIAQRGGLSPRLSG